MNLSIERVISIILALACHASFVWAVLGFFHNSGRLPTGMKILGASAVFGMFVHLNGLAFYMHVSAMRFLAAGIYYGCSLMLFWWALTSVWQCRLPIAFSSQAPKALLRHGPYAFVRHPIYLSDVLAWLAGAVAINGPWAWFVFILMTAEFYVAMITEERQLGSGQLAEEFAQYAHETGMILPSPYKIVGRLMRKKAKR